VCVVCVCVCVCVWCVFVCVCVVCVCVFVCVCVWCVFVCLCVCMCVCVYVCVCTICIFFKSFLHNIKQVNENTWTVAIKKRDSIKPTFVIRTEMTSRQLGIDSQRALHLLKGAYMR